MSPRPPLDPKRIFIGRKTSGGQVEPKGSVDVEAARAKRAVGQAERRKRRQRGERIRALREGGRDVSRWSKK